MAFLGAYRLNLAVKLAYRFAFFAIVTQRRPHKTGVDTSNEKDYRSLIEYLIASLKHSSQGNDIAQIASNLKCSRPAAQCWLFFRQGLMKSLQEKFVRYAAGYALLYCQSEITSSWVSLRNIFIQAQCSTIEKELADSGWKIMLFHHPCSAYPYFVAKHRYGRIVRINYIDYQKELALIS